MYFLTIIANMFQTFDFAFVECCVGTTMGTKCHLKKIKIMKDVNDDELVLSSSRVVLEVNERGGGDFFYKTMRDIVEKMYRCYFHL
jgi:hypothetical protein